MQKFTHDSFLEYANAQTLALKGDSAERATARRESLTKALEVATATRDDFEIEVFKSDEETTPNTVTEFDLKASAPVAAKYTSAVATNLDMLLGEASDLAKSEPLTKRDLGLDEQGFPEDMNDPDYLKGKPNKPAWDFDR